MPDPGFGAVTLLVLVKKRDRLPTDWKVVIHTPTRRCEEVVDVDIYQEQMLHRPYVINVDECEIIQLDGGDDPQEMDHALLLVSDNEEEDGYESSKENDSESGNYT
ncbi:hypothetical protein POM88_021364 [Heracleum sosnowskyi]|uniref:Uncharacterized protein n=1 Tax=Heracleum sosnowskyi TaxID=360622 RepID=A0AAD8MSU0_9APIA|nr:hypothetical protein POM88_021364 [Heracleum sosnowskyi]